MSTVPGVHVRGKRAALLFILSVSLKSQKPSLAIFKMWIATDAFTQSSVSASLFCLRTVGNLRKKRGFHEVEGPECVPLAFVGRVKRI